MNSIEIKSIKKIREKGGITFELNIPKMMIKEGQFIVIVGPSGCGKSTLLDILGLILRASALDNFFYNFGKDKRYEINKCSDSTLATIRRKNIGYVLQTGGLLPFLTVRENILIPCYLNKLNNQNHRVEAFSKELGISDQLSKKPAFLSGGQRQRVAIARALIHNPNIVLADEPTAAVDRYAAKDIVNIFKKLSKYSGSTVIMVTHDESLASESAELILTFNINKMSDVKTVSILSNE